MIPFLMKTAAFFDIDRTLIDGQSGVLLGKLLVKKGEVKASYFISRALYYSFLYRINRLNYGHLVEHGMKFFEGMRQEEMDALGEECFEKAVRKHIYKEAETLVDSHKKQGHACVIVSSAPKLVAKPIAAHFKMDDMLVTEGVIKNGVITGELKKPLCYADGKRALAEKFAKKHHVELSRSYFYSDSATDAPLFEAVGHPVAVNPERKLLSIAKKRKWKILRFRKHAG